VSEIDSIVFVPEDLQQLELYPKLQGMMNHIIDNALVEFEDVRYKYSGPDVVREEVISEIIKELGFSYITEIMSTLTGYEFNTLLEFVGLINLLKGSREGLELVLKLLGLDALIQEWWEQSPTGEPDTFIITVIMNTTYVTDPLATLNKVKDFVKEYVYPTISNIDFRFTLSFAEKNCNFGAFSKAYYYGQIQAALPI
jgi:hypothetical protein